MRKIKNIISKDHRILIVGDFPRKDELLNGLPFAGYNEKWLSEMLQEAAIDIAYCSQTLVCSMATATECFSDKKREGWKPLGAKHCSPKGEENVAVLHQLIRELKPNVILALGDLALLALTGHKSVTLWRGSLEKYCDPQTKEIYKVIGTIHPDALKAQYEWRDIVTRDLRRVKAHCDDKTWHPPVEDFCIRPGKEEVITKLLDLLSRVEEEPIPLAFDIETRGGSISCLGIAWSTTEAICIPFMDVTNRKGYWNADDEVEILYLLYRLMTHQNFYGIAQNGNYDIQFIERVFKFTPNLQFDTIIAHHSHFPSGQADDKGHEGKGATLSVMKKNLGFLSSLYCKDHRYWKNALDDWQEEDEYWTYNCRDCVATFEVYTVLSLVMKNKHPKQQEVFNFQQSLFYPMLSITNRGIRFDTILAKKYRKYLANAINEREQWLEKVLGYKLNLQSSVQMKDLFYRQLKQPPVLVAKGKGAAREEVETCDNSALVKIAQNEPLLGPIIEKIQDIRSAQVFLSTHLGFTLSKDHRIRCSYDIAGTKTYRFAHRKTAFDEGANLGNTPKWEKQSTPGRLQLPDLRELQIPDPGYTLFDADLDSADLRIVVWESGCVKLKKMFAAGLKPYVEVAKIFYNDPTIDKNHPEYKKFKSLCHGTNYGGSATGLASQLGMPVKEIEKIQKWWFSEFPEVEKWHKRIRLQIETRKYVENVFGYRNVFMGRITNDTFREAVAWIPQSTVANIIDRALVRIYTYLPQVQLLNQVHDSLVGQYPTCMENLILPKVKQCLLVTLPYSEPLTIPSGTKTSIKSWGDCG